MNAKEFLDLQDAYVEVCEQETGRGPRISDTYDERDAEGGPKGGGTIKGPKKKNVIKTNKEEVENWVNSLIEEGYDLSEYTWDEMVEIYLDEELKSLPKEKMERQAQGAYRKERRAIDSLDTPEANIQMQRRIAMQSPASRRTVLDKKNMKEETDVFTQILEYLVAEGYADTNENALAIMANMSEEWKQSIVEEDGKLLAARKKSIRRLNAAKNIEDRQAEGDYENPIDHSNPSRGTSGYMEVPTDYRARRRRASGR